MLPPVFSISSGGLLSSLVHRPWHESREKQTLIWVHTMFLFFWLISGNTGGKWREVGKRNAAIRACHQGSCPVCQWNPCWALENMNLRVLPRQVLVFGWGLPLGELNSQDLCTRALRGQGNPSFREMQVLAVGGWVRTHWKSQGQGGTYTHMGHQQLSVITCIGFWKSECSDVMVLSKDHGTGPFMIVQELSDVFSEGFYRETPRLLAGKSPSIPISTRPTQLSVFDFGRFL